MINKFQQGGAAPQLGGGILALIQQLPQEQQQLIMQAFAQWAQLKGVDIQQLQSNPAALEQALGQFMQEMQAQQSQMARHGAKLNYIKKLKHQCAEDEELKFFARGGNIDCGCVKKDMKGGKAEPKKNALQQFKDSKKPSKKCGGKMKKHQIGGTLETLRQSLGLEKKMIKAQDGTKLPTAPKAEDRYANSIRLYAGDPRFKYDIRYLDGQTTGVVLDTPYTTIPASITLQVVGNDTIYRETPDQKRFSLRGFPVTRTATNTDSNRQEFETMRRRFNTAWGVAKHEEGSKIKPSPATPYNRGLNKFNTTNSVPEVIVKGNRPYRFDRRVSDQGAGHKVASDILWNEYQNGEYAGDLSGIAGGRTIYYSPQGNDTVYMNPSPIGYFMDQPGLNWIDNGGGFMPVPANRNNLTRNKKAFYGNIRKSHVGANDTWMRPIFQRAKRGN